jgi:hypothetical protein
MALTGVTITEIMVAHLVNQFTVLCGQTALVFLLMLVVFAIPCHGSLASAVFIRVGQIKYRISHLVDKVLIRRGIMR